MAAIGAKYRWNKGRILHTSSLWKSPSKRRIPRIMVEDRALEVGVLMYLEEPWMVFEETEQEIRQIDSSDAIELELYLGKFFLLPEKVKGQDTYQWLSKPGNAILLWGENKELSSGSLYFVKAVSLPYSP